MPPAAARTPTVAGRAVRTRAATYVLIMAASWLPLSALADEGGVSFWLPGIFGSLAAVPQQPGFSLPTFYYQTTVSAKGDVALSREFMAGRVPGNVNATLNARLNATGDLGAIVPTYVFGTPFLGG